MIAPNFTSQVVAAATLRLFGLAFEAGMACFFTY